MGLFDWLAWWRRQDPTPTATVGSGSAPELPPAGAGADGSDRPSEHLLFPKARYSGEFTPENLAFDSNLQEFAQRVSYICSLENSGKITPNDAHQQIRALWKKLARSYKGLNIAE
jgi:hypothetical protein